MLLYDFSSNFIKNGKNYEFFRSAASAKGGEGKLYTAALTELTNHFVSFLQPGGSLPFALDRVSTAICHLFRLA